MCFIVGIAFKSYTAVFEFTDFFVICLGVFFKLFILILLVVFFYYYSITYCVFVFIVNHCVKMGLLKNNNMLQGKSKVKQEE